MVSGAAAAAMFNHFQLINLIKTNTEFWVLVSIIN